MRYWWTALSGVVFVVLIVVGGILQGEIPDVESPVEEIVAFYADDTDAITAGSFMIGLGTIFLVLFAGSLAAVLRRTEGELRTLPTLGIVGAAIFAVGLAFDATITLALAQTVDEVEPVAVQTLQALWDYDFMAIAIGGILFFASSGIAIIRSQVLPRWLGWLGILAAVVMPTPVFFVGLIIGGGWLLIASVMLTMRSRAMTA